MHSNTYICSYLIFLLLLFPVSISVSLADGCVFFSHNGGNSQYNGCYITQNGQKACSVNPYVSVDNGDAYSKAYIKYNIGFLADSVTWTFAEYYLIGRGKGDDGYIYLYTSQPFDPETLSWSDRPQGKLYIGSTEKHSSRGTVKTIFNDINLIRDAFSGTAAFFRVEGEADGDGDEEAEVVLTALSGDYHYFKACYTGTPLVCNPGEACCSANGYSFLPSGTACGPIDEATCDIADMSLCLGHARQDQCDGASSACPNNNALITYNQACSGTDVGVCSKCDGGSQPAFDLDNDDCSFFDCDSLDTSCRDYSDIQQCISKGTCASSSSYCTSYANKPTGTDCGSCGSCDDKGICRNDHDVVCTYDNDCNEGNTATKDVCHLEGTCRAYCSNELWCGNSLCDGTETKNSCPADCPSVCADNVCEGLENCYNCENDCGKCEGDAFELIYDQNGNLIKDINYEYHFNSFNQLDSVSKRGRQIAQYSYDHNGKRIKKVVFSGSANTTTYYLGNMVRVILGNSSIDTTYYSHDGQLVGSKSNGSTYYYHPDHLGSTNLITDDRGGFVSRSGYMPFGEQIIGMGDRYSFTGQEKDSETELMYYGARYYSPILGRFTQPDTLLQNVYDPQLLNRYSYARNNPLKYTDPSGHAIPVLAFAALMIAIQVIVPAILGYLAGYAVGATADIGKQLYEKRHAERLDIDFNEVNDAGNEIGGPLAASMGTQGLLEGLSLNIGSFLPSTKPVPAKAQTDY